MQKLERLQKMRSCPFHLLVDLVVLCILSCWQELLKKKKLMEKDTANPGLEFLVVFGPAARKRMTRRPEH